MSYIHPAAAEHLRKRWMRPDAYRFARPGTPEARPPWERGETASADNAMSAAENDAFEHELLHLRWLVKSMRLELALRRFQEKYSPDQPRVPAGNSDGGQWTGDGGEGAGNEQSTDSAGSGAKRAQAAGVDPERIRLAGDITGFTRHGMYRAMQRGISPSAMQDAVVSPLQIIPQANGNTQYVGRDAVVVLNPLGQVVTVWGSR